MMIIISGGQTGVDIGALYGAREIGLPTGGYAPHGWKTELGSNESELKSLGLVEHIAVGYKPRTEANIKRSDGTLILANDFRSAGTNLTQYLCSKSRKPTLCVHVTERHIMEDRFILPNLLRWIQDEGIHVMNVAGNRESKFPGIQEYTMQFIMRNLKG